MMKMVEKEKGIIELNGVTKIYGKGKLSVTAVDNISFTINKGEVVTIMGPSGSGKSTLLNLLGAMDSPTSGNVIVDGKDVGTLAERKLSNFRRFSVGFVFQDFYLLPNLNVIDNVMVPLIPYGRRKLDSRVKALQLLDAVDLEDKAYSKVRQLSGGQAQRVAIARALINGPKVILADEPTGNLDSETGKAIIQLLLSFSDNETTVIIVTHDPRIGASVSEHPKGKNIWMEDGKLSDQPTYDQYCWG
jgi:putative ABC transport system ATP-binding protein